MRDCTMESRVMTIRAESEIADPHGHGRELFGCASGGRDRVNIGAGLFVVRLVDARGQKVDACAIVSPTRLAFIEIAGCELLRFRHLIESSWHVQHPDMFVPFGIEKTFVVVAINSAAHDVDIGFMVAVGAIFSGGLSRLA